MSPSDTGESFNNETLRQIVHLSIGGPQVRVRFSNEYGTKPLVISAASIGIQDEGASVVPGSIRKVTFGGNCSLELAVGAEVLSDPVVLTVADEADLAVTVYLPADSGRSTRHKYSWQTSYILPGNFTSAVNMPSAETTSSWYWLTGVEVWAHRNSGAVVTLGDSLTEGWASTPNANARYPDQLARLLLDRYPGEPKKAVLNAGISGDGVLNPIWGPGMVARLDRDVLSQSGVTHVILLGAGNDLIFSDLGYPDVSAEEIIAGYEEIITRVHARGLKILGGTLTPLKGFHGLWSPVKEAKRQAINDWIRSSHDFDGVIDFDAALRDPDDPERLLHVFDSGDHGHLNDAGYSVMALEAESELISLRGGPW